MQREGLLEHQCFCLADEKLLPDVKLLDYAQVQRSGLSGLEIGWRFINGGLKLPDVTETLIGATLNRVDAASAVTGS